MTTLCLAELDLRELQLLGTLKVASERSTHTLRATGDSVSPDSANRMPPNRGADEARAPLGLLAPRAWPQVTRHR